MKFQDGSNKFRILCEPIEGWLRWDSNNKPVRAKLLNQLEGDFPEFTQFNTENYAKNFATMIVWDYWPAMP